MSCVVLHLFAAASDMEIVREQVCLQDIAGYLSFSLFLSLRQLFLCFFSSVFLVLFFLLAENTRVNRAADFFSPFFVLQITRVLIERLIVQKPHPWGLLITLIEV
jgi:hypothetical protein